VIGAAAWDRVPGMRPPAGIMSAGVVAGAIVYVIMRWGLLPPFNPMMAFVPQIAFFLARLLFSLVGGGRAGSSVPAPQRGPGAAHQPVTSGWTARH